MQRTGLYYKLKTLVDKQESEMGEGCGLIDALTELRHLATDSGQDFYNALDVSYRHYQEERSNSKECSSCGKKIKSGEYLNYKEGPRHIGC